MNNLTVSTSQLLDNLCDDLPEKQLFRNPLVYFVTWLVVSVFAVAIYLNLFLEVRFDLAHRFSDPGFIFAIGTMLVGSCAFAYNALANAIPGTKNRYDLVGLLCTFIWMGMIVYTMVVNLGGLMAGKVYLRLELNVFLHIVVAGAMPLALLWFLFTVFHQSNQSILL